MTTDEVKQFMQKFAETKGGPPPPELEEMEICAKKMERAANKMHELLRNARPEHRAEIRAEIYRIAKRASARLEVVGRILEKKLQERLSQN